MEKLWGDNFFDPKTKKWSKKHNGSETCKRGFVQFVYDPIKTVIDACMNEKREKLYDMCSKLGFNLTSQQKELSGKSLMKATLQAWIPAHEVLPPHLSSPCLSFHRISHCHSCKSPTDTSCSQ